MTAIPTNAPVKAATGAFSNSTAWTADFFATLAGLRGLLILWVFWGHIDLDNPNSTLFNLVTPVSMSSMNRAQLFNTAAFVIVSGASTYIQTRDKKLQYGKWIVSKWFALIPVYLLVTLFAFPMIMAGVVAKPTNVSSGTSAYLLITTFMGFGMVTSGGNYKFQKNATAFDIGTSFGDVGNALNGMIGVEYFGSFLFMLFVGYAMFHATLSFDIPRRMFRGFHGMGAVICWLLMLTCSIALGMNTFQPPADPTKILTFVDVVNNVLLEDATGTSGTYTSIWPLMILGACTMEIRHHLSVSIKAALGHWFVVDLSIVAFTVLTFAPIEHLSMYGTGFLTSLPNLTITPEFQPYFWRTIAVSVAQPALFCIVLLCLSCQAYHKSRSIIVFFVLRRSILTDVFGKYSYTFYLIQLPLIFGPYIPFWACIGAPDDTCKNYMSNPAALGWPYKLLVLVLSLALGMGLQYWQDTYVTTKFLQFQEYCSSWTSTSGRSTYPENKRLNSAENPLNFNFSSSAALEEQPSPPVKTTVDPASMV